MKRTIGVVIVCLGFAAGSSAATLTVMSPNGGENWSQGSPHLITWTAVGVSGKVKLILFKGGVNFGDIASDITAAQQSYSWIVGTCDAGTAPAGIDYKIKIRTLDNTVADQSNGKFTIGPPAGPGPGPGPGPAFALTSPNGGESWPLGSTRLITWNPGVATGYVRLDLYKGGSAPANLMGWITSMTSAASGKYSWRVGDRNGMAPAALGEDYYVVIHAYTPDMKDPGNGPFTIAPREHNVVGAAKAAKAMASAVSLSLTNPRRGDRWYKGTGYTITWTTSGLQGSPVRLDLVKIDGTTLVQSIAENIPNNGQHFWAVPMSLPDTETLYKIRLRTVDGTHTDTAGPFPIVKAKPSSGPPAIKVTAPGGPGQLGTGSTYAVRWTSTCGTSVNGPTDDAFDIELMDAAGSTRARWLLESGVAAYDGGNPDGSHSWHWDWQVAWNENEGTYRIRVTNMSGHCVGLGAPFQLVHPQKITEYTIKPAAVWNCVRFLEWCWWGVNPMEAHTADLAYWHLQGGPPSLARVGFRWFLNNTWKNGLHNDSFGYIHQVILWSWLPLGQGPQGQAWYKDKGRTVHSAKFIFTRKYAMPEPTPEITPVTHPCLGQIVLLEASPTCTTNPDPHYPQPAMDLTGPRIPVPAGTGDTWEVDVTDQYRSKIWNEKPDLGWALIPFHMTDPGPGMDCHCQYTYQNVEGYEVVLKIRIGKDVVE